MSKTIAVDFDGVIHAYRSGWQGGFIYDVPVEGAIDALIKLMDSGYKVVIFTTRTNHDDIRKFIKDFALKDHFGRIDDLAKIEITNTKIPAIAYIDDRGIRFTNWSDILKYFR